MGIAPCKDCERRHPGCHGECPEYGEWKRLHDEEQARRREALSRPPLSNEMQRIIKDKILKGRRNRKW